MKKSKLKTKVLKISALAILTAGAMANAYVSAANAKPDQHKAIHHHKSTALPSYGRAGGRVGFAPPHTPHYAALVGDRHGGLGFYQLPLEIRQGAWRHRMRTARPPWANAVRQAAAADSLRYGGYWIPSDPGYKYGVFDPYDGVGTPFFAGYYSGGRDTDDDDDDGPWFGKPSE